jgi:hypothetical protein
MAGADGGGEELGAGMRRRWGAALEEEVTDEELAVAGRRERETQGLLGMNG